LKDEKLISAQRLRFKNMKSKTYICEGYDPLFGPIRDIIDACSYQEAKEKFFNLHGIYALNVDLER
jgi:hypothetical protein